MGCNDYIFNSIKRNIPFPNSKTTPKILKLNVTSKEPLTHWKLVTLVTELMSHDSDTVSSSRINAKVTGVDWQKNSEKVFNNYMKIETKGYFFKSTINIELLKENAEELVLVLFEVYILRIRIESVKIENRTICELCGLHCTCELMDRVSRS